MEKLSQEYLLRLAFSSSIEREELLLKKYEDHLTADKNNDLAEIIKDFKETALEHIKLLKDKRLKMNFEN